MHTCPECGNEQEELCIDASIDAAANGLCDSCYEIVYLASLSDEQKREARGLLMELAEMIRLPDEEDEPHDYEFDNANRLVPRYDRDEEDRRDNPRDTPE